MKRIHFLFLGLLCLIIGCSTTLPMGKNPTSEVSTNHIYLDSTESKKHMVVIQNETTEMIDASLLYVSKDDLFVPANRWSYKGVFHFRLKPGEKTNGHYFERVLIETGNGIVTNYRISKDRQGYVIKIKGFQEEPTSLLLKEIDAQDINELNGIYHQLFMNEAKFFTRVKFAYNTEEDTLNIADEDIAEYLNVEAFKNAKKNNRIVTIDKEMCADFISLHQEIMKQKYLTDGFYELYFEKDNTNKFILVDIDKFDWEELVKDETERQEFQSLIEMSSGNRKTDKYNREMLNAVNSGLISKVEELLKSGANPNGIVNEGAISPLGLACNKGNVDIVKILLQYGADPNYVPKDQSHPLFYTVIGSDKPKILKYLIYAGLNVNYCEEGSDHYIFILITLGHENMLKVMLDSDVDRNIENKEGFTLSDYAKYLGRKRCYEIIVNGKANTDMSKDIEIGSSNLFRNLINHSVDNLTNTIWLNEVILISPGQLVVIDAIPSSGSNTYLVTITGNTGIAKPFLIDSRRSLRLYSSEYGNLLYEKLRLRLAGYGTYTTYGIQNKTYRFLIDGE